MSLISVILGIYNNKLSSINIEHKNKAVLILSIRIILEMNNFW